MEAIDNWRRERAAGAPPAAAAAIVVSFSNPLALGREPSLLLLLGICGMFGLLLAPTGALATFSHKGSPPEIVSRFKWALPE